MKLKANIKVTPSIPLNPRGKFSSLYVLKGEFAYIFVADPVNIATQTVIIAILKKLSGVKNA